MYLADEMHSSKYPAKKRREGFFAGFFSRGWEERCTFQASDT